MFLVITMERFTDLRTVNGIICRVKIKKELIGWGVV
jgi:hypothetical protein